MNDPREHSEHDPVSTDAHAAQTAEAAHDIEPEDASHDTEAPTEFSTARTSQESPVTPNTADVAADDVAEVAAEPAKRLKTGRDAINRTGGSSSLLSGGVATSKAVVVPQKPRKGAAGEQAEVPAFDPATDLPMYREGMDWFVLRVASNKESYVRDTLLRKVQIEGMEHLVGRIMVPTEKTTTLKGKKAKVTETKLYPGYVFVEMKLEPDGRIPQDVFFLIKETTGVGDFVGTAGRPTPMATHEVEKMLFDSKRPDDAPTVRMDFAKGDSVTINEGPFQSFQGTVDEVLPDRGLVRVLVTIFGRQAPVELEYWQIARADE